MEILKKLNRTRTLLSELFEPSLYILLVVGASTIPTSAAAQSVPLQCIASVGVPPVVRAEGFAELAADFVVTCTGGTPTPAGAPIPRINIQVFYNTSVGSRLLTDPFTEVVLLIDEPGTSVNPYQLACALPEGCTVLGTSLGGLPGPEPFDGSPGRPNVFLGRKSFTSNQIVFIGVPNDPPGRSGARTYRVVNARLNANGLSSFVPSTIPPQAVAFFSVSPPGALPINNPQQTVGYVQNGLRFDVRCLLPTPGLLKAAKLQFTELFSVSFKPRTAAVPTGINNSPPPVIQNVPGVYYGSESGFYNPSLLGPGNMFSSAGLANFGTRLMARFSNIPEGAELWVTATNLDLNTKQQARLVSTFTDGSGSFSPVPAPFGTAQLPVSNGFAIGVWEVLAADPQSMQTYTFGVTMISKRPAAKDAVTTIGGTLAPTLLPDQAVPFPSALFPFPSFANAGMMNFCAEGQ